MEPTVYCLFIFASDYSIVDLSRVFNLKTLLNYNYKCVVQ